MYFTTHQFAEGIVDEAVSGNGGFAGEGGRDDEQAIVTATTSGAGMTGVQGRIVNQFQLNRVKQCQPVAQYCFQIAGGVF
jgi:hypothetical protein